MTSRLHPSFRIAFAKLPPGIQRRARAAYRRFLTDPNYPGLQFKRLQTKLPLWSIRISDSYRAVGARHDETIVWFFIGTHAEYDALLARL